MNTERDPIIEKLRKLIAHEKSAREIGNLHEAEAFATRIQTLLDDHKLGMDEVQYADRDAAEPISWERVAVDDINTDARKTKIYWQDQIAKSIADANSCEVVQGLHGTSFFFVGRTTDRELCKMLYIYLVELGDELCEKAARVDREQQRGVYTDEYGLDENPDNWNIHESVRFRGHMRNYRTSWKIGFSDAICKRVDAQHEVTQTKAVGTVALVYMKKDALAVQEFLKGQTVPVKGAARNGSNYDAYARGKSTGSAVALTPNRFAPKSSGKVVGLLGGGQ